MMTELIHDIIMYIEFLKGQGFQLTIHFHTERFSSLMDAFSKYNIHRNPLCHLIKSSPEAWRHCIKRQEKVYRRLHEGVCWGMCYAGVEEYVFPLVRREVFGFISVSGYAVDKVRALPRLRRVAGQYQIALEKLQEAYGRLEGIRPDFGYVNTVMKPLCHMLARAYDLLPASTAGGGSVHQQMVSAIIAYINRHYAKKITLSGLCSLCNVSGSTISHNFKRLTGYSVREYITLVRMTNAKILLMNTGLSVGEIAGLVGYEDANYFTNSFRNTVGVSPRQFRNA